MQKIPVWLWLVHVGYYNPTIDHIQILWNDRTGGFVDTNNIYVNTNEFILDDNIEIFPNPTSGIIHCKSEMYKIKEIIIADSKGVVIFKNCFNINYVNLNLDFLVRNSGIYFCITKLGNNKTYIKKLLITKQD